MKKILLLIIVLLNLSPKPVNAQGLNLSLSPPLLQATIKPGKSISQVFTIYNNSSNPVKLTPRIVPFLPEDDQGNPSLKPQSKPDWLNYFSLANSKIHLNQSFTLQPNQSDQLVLSIRIPENTPPTDHYATLLISSTSETNNISTSITGSIGANILLTTANQASPPTILRLNNFKPINKFMLKIGQTYFLDNLSPIEFTAQLDNLGQHLTESHGLFQVRKGDKTTHIQSLLPTNVLAQSTRQIIASPGATPTSNWGQLKFTPQITNIGHYKASLIIRSQSGSSQSSINLILLPIKALFGLILSIILLQSILKGGPTLGPKPKA